MFQWCQKEEVCWERMLPLAHNFHRAISHQTTKIYSRGLVKTVCLLCKHRFKTSPLSRLSKLPFSDSFHIDTDFQPSYLTAIFLIRKEYVLELVHDPVTGI